MALIKCSECGRDVSDKAPACPYCGCPMEDIISNSGKGKPFLEGSTQESNSRENEAQCVETPSDASAEQTDSTAKGDSNSVEVASVLVVIALLLFGLYFAVQIPYKNNIKSKAEEFGLKDVGVSLHYKLSCGWWDANISCSNFESLSYAEMFEVEKEIDSIPHVFSGYFISNGSKYDIYGYTETIYKDGVSIYDNYSGSNAKKDYTTGNYSGQSSASVTHTNVEAFTCAEEIVEGNLKAPSTARFCKVTEATVTALGGGEYEVKGWVDAENSFGAMIRSEFTVTYTALKNGSDIGYKNATVVFD